MRCETSAARLQYQRMLRGAILGRARREERIDALMRGERSDAWTESNLEPGAMPG